MSHCPHIAGEGEASMQPVPGTNLGCCEQEIFNLATIYHSSEFCEFFLVSLSQDEFIFRISLKAVLDEYSTIEHNSYKYQGSRFLVRFYSFALQR